jgi:hypothetical protein
MLQPKKKIVRRKPGTGPSKNYFTAETQEAIVQFQQAATIQEKHKLYTTRIMPAFDTLVSNLINVYGYRVAFDSKSDLKNECIELLYTVLGKFNNALGTKAFSYFNVVASHWLIIRSKNNLKHTHMLASLDDRTQFTAHELTIIENYHVAPSPDEVVTGTEEKDKLKKLFALIETQLTEEADKACLDSIKVILENVEDIDIVNRRAVLLYLREISRIAPKKLSQALAKIRSHYPSAKEALIRHEENPDVPVQQLLQTTTKLKTTAKSSVAKQKK